MDIVQALRNTDLFGELDEPLLRNLAKKFLERRLSRDEILFVAGEKAAGLYVVVSGSVRAFRTGPDGREQIIHIEPAGATIGELPMFDDQPYPSTVAAEEDSVVLFLDKPQVLEMCHAHPEIAMAALRVLSRRLRRCAGLVETLSLRAVGQRLALWLLNEAKTHGRTSDGGADVDLRISKEQLAARIGSVREVVSRAIARLDEEGLIHVKGQQIHIPDVQRLTDYIERI